MESNEETLTNSSTASLNKPSSDPKDDDDSLPLIDYSSFEELDVSTNEIGDEIFKARWKENQSDVVLKKIQHQSLQHLKSSYKWSSYHQNILSIFGYCQNPVTQDYLLVTECPNGKDLRTYLKENHKNLDWTDKINLAINIASGLQCIHSHDIVHLALHPYNIFVHNNKLSIGDLGLSRSVSADISDIDISDISTPDEISKLKIVDIDINILPYFDSKFIANPSYTRDKKSDIYSLGLIMYEISSGKAPFASVPNGFELRNRILSGEMEKQITGTPTEYIDLYELCWDNDLNVRPNAEYVLAKLSRMGLSPVYEGNEGKKKVDFVPLTQNELNHAVIFDNLEYGSNLSYDNGNVGSGGQGGGRKERKCQPLPCLPSCRMSFGVFLCWICIIVFICSFFLGWQLTRLIKAN